MDIVIFCFGIYFAVVVVSFLILFLIVFPLNEGRACLDINGDCTYNLILSSTAALFWPVTVTLLICWVPYFCVYEYQQRKIFKRRMEENQKRQEQQRKTKSEIKNKENHNIDIT